jgi:hypothetical protein
VRRSDLLETINMEDVKEECPLVINPFSPQRSNQESVGASELQYESSQSRIALLSRRPA